MKSHIWGREVKTGPAHFHRACERKGCGWNMCVKNAERRLLMREPEGAEKAKKKETTFFRGPVG